MLILIARMTPALSYLIPLFTVFQFLGLNNTLTALVITHLVITVPIIVYVMVGYFETLPRSSRRRRMIDGASAWKTLPLRRAAARAAGHRRRRHPRVHLLVEQFRLRRSCSAAANTRTLPAAVYNVLTFEQLAWGPLAAAAIDRHAAGAGPHGRRAAPDRRGTHERSGQGRLGRATPMRGNRYVGFPLPLAGAGGGESGCWIPSPACGRGTSKPKQCVDLNHPHPDPLPQAGEGTWEP